MCLCVGFCSTGVSNGLVLPVSFLLPPLPPTTWAWCEMKCSMSTYLQVRATHVLLFRLSLFAGIFETLLIRTGCLTRTHWVRHGCGLAGPILTQHPNLNPLKIPLVPTFIGCPHKLVSCQVLVPVTI